MALLADVGTSLRRDEVERNRCRFAFDLHDVDGRDREAGFPGASRQAKCESFEMLSRPFWRMR